MIYLALGQNTPAHIQLNLFDQAEKTARILLSMKISDGGKDAVTKSCFEWSNLAEDHVALKSKDFLLRLCLLC